jgi:hypothetical protein
VRVLAGGGDGTAAAVACLVADACKAAGVEPSAAPVAPLPLGTVGWWLDGEGMQLKRIHLHLKTTGFYVRVAVTLNCYTKLLHQHDSVVCHGSCSLRHGQRTESRAGVGR